jgi:hypothetical protein
MRQHREFRAFQYCNHGMSWAKLGLYNKSNSIIFSVWTVVDAVRIFNLRSEMNQPINNNKFLFLLVYHISDGL